MRLKSWRILCGVHDVCFCSFKTKTVFLYCANSPTWDPCRCIRNPEILLKNRIRSLLNLTFLRSEFVTLQIYFSSTQYAFESETINARVKNDAQYWNLCSGCRTSVPSMRSSIPQVFARHEPLQSAETASVCSQFHILNNHSTKSRATGIMAKRASMTKTARQDLVIRNTPTVQWLSLSASTGGIRTAPTTSAARP